MVLDLGFEGNVLSFGFGARYRESLSLVEFFAGFRLLVGYFSFSLKGIEGSGNLRLRNGISGWKTAAQF